MHKLASLFSFLFLTASALGGCTGGVVAMPPRSVYVSTPPPGLLDEVATQAPAPLMVRVPGYWYWNDQGYVWIPGHWESPRVGKHWRLPTAQRASKGDGLVYEQGRWEDD